MVVDVSERMISGNRGIGHFFASIQNFFEQLLALIAQVSVLIAIVVGIGGYCYSLLQ